MDIFRIVGLKDLCIYDKATGERIFISDFSKNEELSTKMKCKNFDIEDANCHDYCEELCDTCTHEDGSDICNRCDCDNLKWEKRNFTKSDLKNGDVVLRRNGDVEIAIVDIGVFVRKDGGYNDLESVDEDLTFYRKSEEEWDIVKVKRPVHAHSCTFKSFELSGGNLVYEREEKKEIDWTKIEQGTKILANDNKLLPLDFAKFVCLYEDKIVAISNLNGRPCMYNYAELLEEK